MAEINADLFYQRLSRLQESWLNQKASTWANADCLCIVFGNSNDNIYSKPAALHLFLLGYEDFTDSIIVISKGNFYFLSSSKKCQVLQQQVDGKGEGFALHFIEKSKDETTNAENFSRLILNLKKGGAKNVGYLAKEKPENSYLTQFLQTLDESDVEKVDITNALGLFFAAKDETEFVRGPLLHPSHVSSLFDHHRQ